MSRFLPVCDGVLTSQGATLQCTGGAGWISVDATYMPGQFDINQLDKGVCASSFASGFIMIASILLVARLVSVVLKAIRVF